MATKMIKSMLPGKDNKTAKSVIKDLAERTKDDQQQPSGDRGGDAIAIVKSKRGSLAGAHIFQHGTGPEDTVVIFDWDDTLFPTTWVRDDMNLAVERPCPRDPQYTQPLAKCCAKAIEALRTAKALAGRVSIVTLAANPWVHNSIKNFYPKIHETIEMLEIPIVYARDAQHARDRAGRDSGQEYDKKAFQQGSMQWWTNAKALAIAEECENWFMGRPWRNVISIGDSDFEREGTRIITREWAQKHRREGVEMPRCKTIKMLDDPLPHEVIDQLKLINSWMSGICRKDHGFNIDMNLSGGTSLQTIESLIQSNEGMHVELPGDAKRQGHLFKLNDGGDPMNASDWLRRRMWLSKTGRLWYESMKEGAPIMYFAGLRVSMLEIGKVPEDSHAESVDKVPLFPMYFRVMGEDRTTMLACESEAERDKFLDDFQGPFESTTSAHS